MIADAHEYFMIRGKHNMKKDEPVPNHHMRTLIPLKMNLFLVLHAIIIDFFIFLTMYLVDEDELFFVISMQNVVSQ